MNIDYPNLLKQLDLISSINQMYLVVFFILNIYVLIFFCYVNQAVIDLGYDGDASLIIVPSMGLVSIILLYHLNRCMYDILTEWNILGVVMSGTGLIILFGLIPMLGFHFDVMGISADYWSLTMRIIYIISCYLIVFAILKNIIHVSHATEFKNKRD